MSTNMFLSGLVGNQMAYQFQVFFDGDPMDLTFLDVEFYLKADSDDPDNSGTVYTIGHGVTLVDAVNGIVQVIIPAVDLGVAEDVKAWHLDLVDPSLPTNRQTAIDGIFGVNTD